MKTPVHEWRPCGLFHTMLEKIIPYAARGVIWYQGESDQFFAEHYAKMLTGVIHCWRNSWNDELPFLISHLASLAATAGGKNFEVIRAQQEQVARELQGVCTVPIDDIGEEFALHPRTKRPVGERLAGVALQEIYGKSKNAFAPAFSRYMRLGSAIRLSFTDAEGLCTPNLDEEPFAIQAGESTVPKELYQLSMENGEVLIRLDDRLAVKRLSIHFASAGYCKVQLKNRFGLPVKPFMVNV